MIGFATALNRDAEIVVQPIDPGSDIPNHRHCPLIAYRGALTLSGPDPAALFEALFAHDGWGSGWRDYEIESLDRLRGTLVQVGADTDGLDAFMADETSKTLYQSVTLWMIR